MGIWESAVPDLDWIWEHIERIFRQGIRRPGFPADHWTERYVADSFAALGLERVRREPLEVPHWEDHATLVQVGDHGLDCFALPFCEPTTVTAPLARFDLRNPGAVAGCIAVVDVQLMRMPAEFPVWGRRAAGTRPPDTGPDGSMPDGAWAFDPDRTLASEVHLLPFPLGLQEVMDPAIRAGAVGFIGLLNLPGGGCRYYVPYDGTSRSIPGAYVSVDAAAPLHDALAAGATATVRVDATRGLTTSHNIVGELPGRDDEWVVVGSHHDGPWSSAVEDASGVSLVLAQAHTWAAVPAEDRPHRLVFTVNAAHMTGGAGTKAFIARHRPRLPEIVLEVHLEHAARQGPEQFPDHPDRPAPRWWFTSEDPALERAVWDAIVAEDLRRSLVMTPTALGPRPTTDGGFFHDEGVPLVNFLTAPWYLFDPRDGLDKVHRESLTALTRAAARIIESTAGRSAAEVRAAMRRPRP